MPCLEKINVVSAFEVANFFIDASCQSYSNLMLQKLVYLSNLLHVVKFNQKLVKEHFEAWNGFPAVPNLYDELKQYGAERIKKTIYLDNKSLTDIQIKFLSYLYQTFKDLSHSKLTELVTIEGGAFSKIYSPYFIRPIIQEDLIKEEAKAIINKTHPIFVK